VLIGLLCLGEYGARVYLDAFASREQFQRFATVEGLRASEEHAPRFVRHYYLGYMPTPGYSSGDNHHTESGFRGAEFPLHKPPGTYRIVCMGGSTTYGACVDDDRDAYPAQLEGLLRESGVKAAEVINAGTHGWTSFETLINFELRVLELEPDMVIVHHAVNDLHTRLTWPPKAFTSDNLSRRSRPTPVLSHSVLEHSTLARMILIAGGWIESPSRLDRNYGKPDNETLHTGKYRSQMESGTYPEGIFTHVSAERMMEVNTPRYFERNLRCLVALAEAHDIAVVLVSMPYDDTPGRAVPAVSPLYHKGFEEMAEVMRGIADSSSARFFDLRLAYPERTELFVDGIHMNEEGSRVKAELIHGFLKGG